MEKKELLYEGKAKQVYATEDENIIIMHFKDDATAGNGAKHAQFAHKGELNCAITTIIYNISMIIFDRKYFFYRNQRCILFSIHII